MREARYEEEDRVLRRWLIKIEHAEEKKKMLENSGRTKQEEKKSNKRNNNSTLPIANKKIKISIGKPKISEINYDLKISDSYSNSNSVNHSNSKILDDQHNSHRDSKDIDKFNISSKKIKLSLKGSNKIPLQGSNKIPLEESVTENIKDIKDTKTRNKVVAKKKKKAKIPRREPNRQNVIDTVVNFIIDSGKENVKLPEYIKQRLVYKY